MVRPRRPGAIVALGIAAALAAIAGAILLLRDDRVELSAGSARADAATAASALPEAASSAAASADTSSARRAAVEANRDAEVASTASPAIALEHGPADGWPLLVVERATDQPIAGATVEVLGNWFDSVDFDVELARTPGQGVEGRVAAVTDERGIARVPRSGNEWVVFATADGLRGVGFVSSASPRPLKLALGPPRQLAVRVVDRAGRPRAGLPVRFGRYEGDSDWDGYGRRAFTDADGRATIDGVDLVPPANDESHFGVRVLMFGPERLFAPLDLDPLPQTPVELVVPDFGIVVARVVDERGATARCGGSVELQGIDPAPEIQSAFLNQTALVDGVARWLPVALGLRVRVVAQLEGADAIDAEGAGPARDGETVELRVPVSLVKPWITGRVLLPEGSPLASAKLLVRLISEGAGGAVDDVHQREVVTAADGRFRVDGRELLDTGRGTIALQPQRRPGAAGDELSVAVALGDVRDRAEVDVGDVRLAARPVIVAGMVVDDAGRPVFDAQLHVDLGGELALAELATLDLVELRSGEDGRFAMFGSLTRSRADVRAERDDLLVGKPVEFAIGARDVRVVLTRPGRLRGSARVQAGIPADLLVLELRPRELPLAPSLDRIDQDLGRDGVFEIGGLWPGRYDATLRLRGPDGVAEELVTIPGVVVRAGERCVDPRLESIDVVGRARAIRVHVAGPEGEPVDDVLVRAFRPSAPGVPVATRGLDDGVATFLTLGASLTVEAWAEGYRLERLADVREDVELRLRRGLARPLRLHVELPPCAEQLESPVVVVATLDGIAPFPDAGWTRCELGERGDATLELSDPGRWRLTFMLDVPYRNWAMGRDLDRAAIDHPPTCLDVDATSEPIDLTIELPSRVLTDAAERQRRSR